MLLHDTQRKIKGGWQKHVYMAQLLKQKKSLSLSKHFRDVDKQYLNMTFFVHNILNETKSGENVASAAFSLCSMVMCQIGCVVEQLEGMTVF